jgi:hypothetical protein
MCKDDPNVRAIMIRGVSQQLTDIHHNWFPHPRLDMPIHRRANVEVHDNAYGRHARQDLDRRA